MESKRTVLIVEDDAASAEMLMEMLGMADYAVDLATTLDAAAMAMGSGRYGAVLLDLSLPGGTTSELIERLCRVPLRPPTIIFSARMPEELRAAAGQLGAAATLQKPVRMEALLTTIERVIASEA
jgi:DNA-binding response OmpR family regulator